MSNMLVVYEVAVCKRSVSSVRKKYLVYGSVRQIPGLVERYSLVIYLTMCMHELGTYI
jgi:hypothetical protein